MKLYATVSSERASKGQGGNEYIEIELSDDQGIIAFLTMKAIEDGFSIELHPIGNQLDGKVLELYRRIDELKLVDHQWRETKSNKQEGEYTHCKLCGNDFQEKYGHQCKAI